MINLRAQFFYASFRFSLKKGGRDGDDGTEEVTVLKLVEKSTLSTLQRASLVEKSSQKPPKRMRVLSDALKTSNYGSEPMLQNCGISISTGFTQVDGRVLPSPRVPEEYSTKFDGSSILKRVGEGARFGSSWLERWMKERENTDDDEEKISDKILKVDTWKPPLRSLKGKEEVCLRTADNSPQTLLALSSSRRHGAPSMAMQGTRTTCPTRTLLELRMMIPNCHNRLEAALADLKGALQVQVAHMLEIESICYASNSWHVGQFYVLFQAELEESNEKEGPEIDDAKSTIDEVEKVVGTTEA
ncbi:hypothetical protein AHAS_Ahas16G0154500 [Arachis hypogaea]